VIIGAHVSIAGGIDRSIERGAAIGATAIQTFASSPRTLQFNPFDQDTVTRYLSFRKNSPIVLHVFHAIYLVNLASEKPDYQKISIQSLKHYQQAAATLNVLGTIFHVGSHKGNGFDTVCKSVSEAIVEVLNDSPPDIFLLIENAAGHAGTVGQTVDELAKIFDEVDRIGGNTKQLGLCLDTQHAFAAGVDAREMEQLNNFLEEIDQKVGLKYVKVIHTNDSKVEANSHKDRHENIGDGILGNTGLSNWINHKSLSHLPFILEVPGLDKSGPRQIDVLRLHHLIQKSL